MFCVTPEVPTAAAATAVDRALLSNVSVVAGHFGWGVWEKLPSYAAATAIAPADFDGRSSSSSGTGNGGTQKGDAASTNSAIPPCFIMLRHPTARVISYYYQRVYRANHPLFGKRLSEHTDADIDFIVTSMRHPSLLADGTTSVITDEGMADAMCRTVLGRRETTGHVLQGGDLQLPAPLEGSAIIQAAIDNANHCVVGIQERMAETLQVLGRWFPWIHIPADAHLQVDNRGKIYTAAASATAAGADAAPVMVETVETLPARVRDRIEGANGCDMQLYHAALLRFAAQQSAMVLDAEL